MVTLSLPFSKRFLSGIVVILNLYDSGYLISEFKYKEFSQAFATECHTAFKTYDMAQKFKNKQYFSIY